jgi:hypothetical protein
MHQLIETSTCDNVMGFRMSIRLLLIKITEAIAQQLIARLHGTQVIGTVRVVPSLVFRGFRSCSCQGASAGTKALSVELELSNYAIIKFSESMCGDGWEMELLNPCV